MASLESFCRYPRLSYVPIVGQAELSGLNMIQKAIKELQEEGFLVREGSNRNGRWIVVKPVNETEF